MHNNMITINGQKMGKSLGNFITLDEFFTGSHEKLERAYSPMTIRLFILMAHYRSTVDFSNEALQASEKALERLLDGWRRIDALKPSETSEIADEMAKIDAKCQEALDDDLNTPIVIAHLFEAASLINKVNDGLAKATAEDIEALRNLYQTYFFQILGLVDEQAGGSVAGKDTMEPYRGAVDLLLQIRGEAKAKKDWATSDLIRDKLAALGFAVKDTKNGAEWSLK
jgi:cysteinyl-tRNA synthetase